MKKRRIGTVQAYECKRCKKTYYSTDQFRGWCDSCRKESMRKIAKRRSAKAEKCGQMRLFEAE